MGFPLRQSAWTANDREQPSELIWGAGPCALGPGGGFDFFGRVGIATAARSQLAARARGWRWAARRCEDDRHAAPVDAMSWSADRQCGIPGTFNFKI